MKSDKYGTSSEQSRFMADYMKPSAINKAWPNRCKHCTNATREVVEYTANRCAKLDTVVHHNGTCRHFHRRTVCCASCGQTLATKPTQTNDQSLCPACEQQITNRCQAWQHKEVPDAV